MQRKTSLPILLLLAGLLPGASPLPAGNELAKAPVFAVVEIPFQGPQQGPADTPARDIDFWVRFRHESGTPTLQINGFWDGDGQGGLSGNVFKVRFCPTREGRWLLDEVYSSAPELNRQKAGTYITALPSEHPGFWIADENSPGRRWYRRSDRTHPYIYGNTHYSFLSGYAKGGRPSGGDIAADVTGNARFFKKLRFGLQGDRYPHPAEKPFLDDAGRPTDAGDFSHRPNPRWFQQRVDLAVQTAYAHDLIADLILAGPDAEASRATLRARDNGGDPSPYLKYVAARYGSYPNVWICLSNEYNIREPHFSEEEIAYFGRIMAAFLPYETPLSVHASPPVVWSPRFDSLPPWNDHLIIQKKIRTMAPSADVIQEARTIEGSETVREKPVINDELSYQGAGDRHDEEDTIEAHLGAFLGGGYASTGEKPANKEGQYFAGRFDPAAHSAADNLAWLRQVIDERITFWRMAPETAIFSNLHPDFRGMAWPGEEYVLGTNQAHPGVAAALPPGSWTITRYDAVSMRVDTLSAAATAPYLFDAPEGRAVLFHFKRNASGTNRP